MHPRIGRAAAALTLVAAGVAALAPSAGAAKSSTVKVTIDDDGCPAKLTATAGPNTFKVSNHGSSGDVSEFEILSGNHIIGEVENVAPGLNGSFSLTIKPGTYTTHCTGGTKRPEGKLVVKGSAATRLSEAGQAAVDQYRAYLQQQTAQLVTATKTFTDAVDAGDVDAAKAAYAAARAPYERIEPVAETFGNLDPEIDARAGDVPAKQWGGFHRIEQALWVDNSTAAVSPGVTKALNDDVAQLQGLVQDVELQPAAIANGAVELLNEVSASKITGEEERYSHVDLVDLGANVEGSEAAFDTVKPLLVGKDVRLANDVDARLAAVFAALAPYGHGNAYVAYTALTPADTKAISTAVDALAEPLSRVGKQIVGS